MSRNTTMLCAVLAVSLFALSAQAAALDVCKGLVLQGGSDKGAYQAGVLKGFFDHLGADGIAYDVISGGTIGAVNAAWISQFAKGQEEPMIDSILNFWLTIKASDVYHDWLGGIVQGLFFEPSMYNTKAGMNFLLNHIKLPPQRYVGIGALNANTGAFTLFNNYQNDLSVDDFLTAVMASMGVAGVFPYVDIQQDTFIDASPVKSMDVASVVNQCRALNGNNDANIIIDMVYMTGKSLSTAEVSKFNALKVLVRTLELTSYNNAMIGLIRAKEEYPNVQIRYVVQPSTALPNSDLPISFDHDEIVAMIAQGQADAGTTIAQGPGVVFNQLVEEQRAKQAAKFRQPVVSGKDRLKQYLADMDELMKEN